MKCYSVLLLQLVSAEKADNQVNDAHQTHDEDAEHDADEDVEVNAEDHGRLGVLCG